MDNKEEFQNQFREIITALNDPEFLKKASNDELMGYLFMAERLEDKLKELVEMNDKKE